MSVCLLEQPAMDQVDFQFIAEFLRRRSGLSLKANKAHLVKSRFAPLAVQHGFANVAALVHKLKTADEPLARAATEAMTTNETWFFRDQHPFEYFRNAMLPALLKARARERRLRIWCAGAASGQEPYSLAMILSEMQRELVGWDVEILATDLNAEMVARAKKGLYEPFEVQRGLPLPMLARHFRREGENWRLSKTIRGAVQFRVFNLLDSFARFGKFDVIFCRNVLIYFDEATKYDVARRLRESLADDGYLVLGVAETLLGLGGVFDPLAGQRGIYAKSQAMGLRRAAG
jgi:chemotaxis protein methyltransferase CheR